MNTKDLSASIDRLTVDKETKDAILEIIDQKIENDMKEVLNEIKRLEDKQDTKFSMLIWAMGVLMALMIALKFFSN